ncbi:hypothetical protein [Paracidovorax citrulli]|uniref:hypothetical protein n=1 Tax=Paracidovorax citrulli TaxID=80869 RepID=UPI00094391C8|nr:hypothetical protein [Paracidovorax citrulli]UMT89853.1 hypothetical protein FRC90_18420 [Paracidovorax citrulli]UMT93888.1 hypothetical protein FRC97_02015 [Paracidovorax citrulli]
MAPAPAVHPSGATLRAAPHPAMSGDPLFAGTVSLLYGVFAGAGAGRALRLLGLWWSARGAMPLGRT